VSYEDPSGAIDMPQRIMISYDLQFANANDFPATSGGEAFVGMQASLTYDVDTGGGHDQRISGRRRSHSG